MKEKELKEILKSKFELADGKYLPEPWKRVLSLFFKKTEYYSSPDNPFIEMDKVIDGKEIGSVRLDDGKKLGIFAVEVSDNVNIVRNRQGLREIAAKHIDQNIIHGALTFFFNKNQEDYRFTFIAKESSLDPETGQLVKGETKPKRYTYLLGANEVCTTAAKRMMVLADKREKGEITLSDLKEVFSVEALNKDFFKSYKAHYEKFWKHLAHEENPFRERLIDAEKDTKEKQEKPIRDFAKKLLGRIVFLHFLQKKGWMGCPSDTESWTGGDPRFMQSLYESFEPKALFHSKCLTRLFFETLNTKSDNDLFFIEGLTGKLNGSRVPYLNGGLFEPEKNKTTLKIDFPPDFFRELLEFFDQYNFTIDENSPDDHEVGIDPEMLGHIFENLLEDYREKGAFYTPKEIVQYMCKESLIQYLLNTFREQKDIEQFVRFHTVTPFLAERENAQLLNRKLDEIKVCDPAIGSGAFPIGMLQEIFEAKRFIYPYLKTTQPFNPAEVKKNIIQNSIYGVDMEKGAVDIAQLRFWLALVVEEENPHPLPNLDYKIMQGDSLLEQYEGIDLSQIGISKGDVQIVEPEADLFGYVKEPQYKFTYSKSDLREKIDELISDFFSIENPERKKSIREQINKLVLEHIEYNIEKREYQLSRFINEAGKVQNLSKAARKKYDEYVRDLFRIKDTKQRLIKIQETDERPYFLWHLYFKDLMEKGGFDVMIGNPPYIQLQKMGQYTDVLQQVGFETFARTGDIYCLFYEKGIELLKKGSGILSFITSNSWMKTKYGEPLRSYFVQKSNPLKLLNFEDTQIFPSATVEVNILVIKKQEYSRETESVNIKENPYKKTIYEYFEENSITLDNLSSSEWILLSKNDYLIKKHIEEFSSPLWSYNLQISRGIVTGFNEAFIVDNSTKIKLEQANYKNIQLLKKFIGGRDINKYKVHWNNEWLIYSHSEVKQSEFPDIIDHLAKYREALQARRGGMNPKTGEVPYKWWQLQVDYFSSGTYRNYELPKIMWAELSDTQKFTFDDTGIYPNKTIFIITGDFIKSLLTILNSRVILWFFNQTSTTSGMGTTIWSKYKVEQLPIPIKFREYSQILETLAEYLIFLNEPLNGTLLEKESNESVIQVFEDLVDMMVYELYFEHELKSKEIDVLRFFNEQNFPKIDKSKNSKFILQKVFYELQQKDNPIRNRILVASSRSETIARITAATR